MAPSPKLDAQRALWNKVKPNEAGLVPCICQEIESGAVLMLAWVNQEALAQTIDTGWATYWSRSRQSLWIKGETSGHRQKIEQIRIDCDGDTLLYQVQAQGPACHLNTDTCFCHIWDENDWAWSPQIVKKIAPK
jgi:phosphoribosyl-AMP cyclohydrolase